MCRPNCQPDICSIVDLILDTKLIVLGILVMELYGSISTCFFEHLHM